MLTETEDSKIDLDAFKDDEPIVVLTPKFSKKYLLLVICCLFVCVYATQKIYISYHTPLPKYYSERHFWYFHHYIAPIGVAIFGYASLLYFYVFNSCRCFKVYKNKIVRKARVPFLPPFNQCINYEPGKIKVDIYLGPHTHMFSAKFISPKTFNICRNVVFLRIVSLLFLGFVCNIMVVSVFKENDPVISFRKQEVLKFLVFLIENVEDDENRKKLQKFKEEVLQWESK